MQSNTKCIVFSDLDGTLLDHFDYSFNAALPAIATLQSNNIPIIINTSKTFAEVVDLQKNLTISAPFIVENGAAIFFPKSYTSQCPDECIEYGDYWMKTFSQPRTAWIELLKREGKAFQDQFQGFSELTNKSIANLTGLSLEDADKANQRLFNEPVLWHDTPAKAQAFIDHIRSHGANVLKGGRFIHVGDFTDKGRALNWLTNLYQSASNTAIKTIALGDGENDTAMLETAHIAVQIRSPVHSFPILDDENFIYQTREYGPKGWAEAMNFLYQDLLIQNALITERQEKKYG
ncbi:HAD-IIB family hydrolase [Thalassotalea eurytherma]|uniref:Mannosyl-3-phosphoglycerate phosphatase n=1 Tax=Thalassotalea eurytherma TaxID=1144278 RepID=A0ABQ6H1K8_9GAMM|nr:HAD-IIB family hydrolase [Thalassotalea eurytherma]GLX82035.1 mannosyl-3-phosphoglycerate phosphatase [Thalassotalea eurytherma]